MVRVLMAARAHSEGGEEGGESVEERPHGRVELHRLIEHVELREDALDLGRGAQPAHRAHAGAAAAGVAAGGILLCTRRE